MHGIRSLIGKDVVIEISGKTMLSGILIDLGPDILVIFDGLKYLYIPLIHLHNIRERIAEEAIQKPAGNVPIEEMSDSLSYRKTLTNAKGKFVEVFVTGNQSIHGYITSVLNDYIVLYSPVYKDMLISMHHLKWLTPYHNSLTPYTLSNEKLPVVPSSMPLARSFEEQLQKYDGKLLVFDLGNHPDKVGLVTSILNNIVHIITAGGESVYWKLSHLKTIHIP